MPKLDQPFDPRTIDTDQRVVIPAGVYPAQIVHSDIKANKNGNGTHLLFEWVFLDGTNRKLTQRINYRNANAEAERIGGIEFARVCKALGFDHAVNETEQMHGRPARIVVEIEVGTGKYAGKQSNVIAGVEPYGPASGAPPANFTPQQPAYQTAQQAAPPYQAAGFGGPANGGDQQPPWRRS